MINNKIKVFFMISPYKVVFSVIIPIKNANRNNNSKSKKWLNSIKTPKAMTKIMEIALSQGLHKPQLLLYKYMISFNYFL